ncbi:unnamed protein product, partial [Ascophyllum nodosum]
MITRRGWLILMLGVARAPYFSNAFISSHPPLSRPLGRKSREMAGERGVQAVSMAAKRDVLRMPSSEPMVPYKREGAQVATWMPVSQRLQQSRIIMVGKFIDDQYANQLIAMLLYHEKEDPTKKISLYFNSPGALIRPALSVYDTLMHMGPEISTLNLGLATGMVSFLCAAGKRGERYALPNARFLMQRTGMEDPYQGQASDIGVEVQNVMKGNSRMEQALQRITGHTIAKIHQDFQRDFYLSSSEAVQYGIIDEVLLPRGKDRQDLYKERGLVGGPRELNDDPDFGTFGGEGQRFGDIGGGGWGGGAGVDDDG